MNSSTQIRLVAGPVGAIDVAIDLPPAGATGIAVIAHPQPLLLAGFSFGGFVQCQVADALARQGSSPRGMVLVAPAVSRFRVAPVSVRTLVIHGEVDDLVPLPAVLDWARPQELPIVVVPGADHGLSRDAFERATRQIAEQFEKYRAAHGG